MYDSSPAAAAVSPELFFQHIRKRNGNVTSFQAEKITSAILKAVKATGEADQSEARRLTVWVLGFAKALLEHKIPEVESIQDLVEEVLLSSPHKKIAKASIFYREQRSLARKLAKKAIGGVLQETIYGDFQAEMTMIKQAFLEGMGEGDAQGKGGTFPLPTYNIAADFYWDNRELDVLWKATAKYGIPSFSICRTRGYLNGEQEKCEHCGAETEIYSRGVGYMRPIGQWNKGKRAAFGKRRHFQLEAQPC